ncbi:MAG TPA: hypothetical protein VIN77_16270 [Aurantimonas sp.]
MTLKIEVGETRRFLLDRAFYGLSDDRKDRMFAQLESDPAVGTPRADRTSLWDWRFGEFDVTYAISNDFSTNVLLELRPRTEKPAPRLERTWDAFDKINKIKRLIGL